MARPEAMATVATGPGVEAVVSFNRRGLSDDVLHGIYGHRFDKPSRFNSKQQCRFSKAET
ncbi:RING-type domain-containing protein [Psidium guajava]|nr:RING-type domain-containing protein [Psidium guajava]